MEKIPFELPQFIADTGIARLRGVQVSSRFALRFLLQAERVSFRAHICALLLEFARVDSIAFGLRIVKC